MPHANEAISNVSLVVYKRNLVQYKTEGYMCQTMKTTVKTKAGFFHEDHRKETKHEVIHNIHKLN